jgi:superfamily II DNA or RNA helicase
MTLASTLERFVNSKVRKRGIHYFRGKRVRLTACGPETAEAVVSGSSEYDVLLTRDSQGLRASCSCPFSDRGEICKHVWAAILAVDVKGGLQGSNGAKPQKLTVVPLPEDRQSAPRKVPVRREPSRPAPRAVTTPRPPVWRETLQRLTAAASPPLPATAKEFLYLLDVPATLRSRQITLEVLTGRRKRDGSWSKQISRLSLTRGQIPAVSDPVDRKILSLIAGASQNDQWQWYLPSASSPLPSPCEIPHATADVLFPLLCATGRFWPRFRPTFELLEEEPLSWDGDDPWALWLEVQENGRECLLTASLRRGGERLEPTTPALMLSSGFVVTGGKVSRLDDEVFRWTPLLQRPVQVPAKERDELLEHLLASPDLPRLDLPESMRFEEVRPAPRPRLRLLEPDWHNAWPRAELSFLYDGQTVTSGSPGRGVYQREERRFLLRDLETERRSADRLRDLGFKPDASASPGEPPLRVPAGRIPKAVPVLLAEGWSVEAEGKLYRSAGRFKMAVASGVDWFELRGEADFEGQTARLPELLAALRRGEKFVPLSDGSIGLLPEEWSRKFAPVAGLGEAEGDHLRFRSVQAALLDAWLADEPATCDETFQRARERLRGFAGVEPAQAPPGFHGELRPYQHAGLGWLHFLRDFGFGGCLADDMGLGKTVQVLALLESRRELREREGLAPSLAVVPRSLVFNWLAEAARFAPRLRVLDHTGAGRTKDGDPFAGCDLVLTTYGTLRQDVAALRKTEFDYVILDEAQAIKNADSQTAKAARLLRGRYRLALSGTPVENHLGELWSLLEFLNPGILGASSTLSAHSEELRDPAPATRELLARALRPFILRRTKEQVAPELPAKVEQTLYCELPPKQRRLYDELRDHYRSSLGTRIDEQGLGRTKILVLEALLRLRQAACHPGLVDRDRAAEPCAKLDLLLPQLREVLAEGHKALVFSQFTSFLALVRDHLDAEGISYLYLDGRTRDRQAKVETFQSDSDCRLFLISLKAGGLGLNLTAADYVYLLDPWWNPAVEAQAIDRAHRIGQIRPVFASRIVARDTVEEKILELQKSKRQLADAVIQADESLLAGLSREDLELLLS